MRVQLVADPGSKKFGSQVVIRICERCPFVQLAYFIFYSGGGLRINDRLDNAAVPVLWMGNEAQHAGLKLEPSPVEWNWEELEASKPTESLTSVWHLFELLPFKRLSYADKVSVVWYRSPYPYHAVSQLTFFQGSLTVPKGEGSSQDRRSTHRSPL
jgi:hypothetical protein